MNGEKEYLKLLQKILDEGNDKPVFNNPGVRIKSLFGEQMKWDLAAGFPLLTTKKVFLKGVIYELLWFLKGSSNVQYLWDHDIHIWDEWADEKGELGNVYGVQWRKWKASDGREIDQLAWIIDKLKRTPHRKSLVVSAWNPEFIYEMAAPGKSMALPPCHTMFQVDVVGDRLNLQLYQRSADMFLGVPFNIASYSLLLMMLAQVSNLRPGTFVHAFGDLHVYSNHTDQVKEQLERTPKQLPTMTLNPNVMDIDAFQYSDFTLTDYNPYPTIKAPVTKVGGF